jgi:hypothetical protein
VVLSKIAQRLQQHSKIATTAVKTLPITGENIREKVAFFESPPEKRSLGSPPLATSRATCTSLSATSLSSLSSHTEQDFFDAAADAEQATHLTEASGHDAERKKGEDCTVVPEPPKANPLLGAVKRLSAKDDSLQRQAAHGSWGEQLHSVIDGHTKGQSLNAESALAAFTLLRYHVNTGSTDNAAALIRARPTRAQRR